MDNFKAVYKILSQNVMQKCMWRFFITERR